MSILSCRLPSALPRGWQLRFLGLSVVCGKHSQDYLVFPNLANEDEVQVKVFITKIQLTFLALLWKHEKAHDDSVTFLQLCDRRQSSCLSCTSLCREVMAIASQLWDGL